MGSRRWVLKVSFFVFLAVFSGGIAATSRFLASSSAASSWGRSYGRETAALSAVVAVVAAAVAVTLWVVR